MEKAIKKADVLIEALPYIKTFREKLFVIKYGGSILSNADIRRSVLEDIVFLYFMGIDVILVHGGGPNINSRLRQRNIEPKFHGGIRVTDKETLGVVQEELNELNRMLAEEITAHRALAIGLEGRDEIIYARKKEADADLGYVGDVERVNVKKLRRMLDDNHIVILCPNGRDEKSDEVYNVNADEVAAAVAGSMKSEKFVLLTDVRGVMRKPGDERTLISSMHESDAKRLIEEGIIAGGMIPKVQSCMDALDKGVHKIHIIDARIPHALLLEIFTDTGIGTEMIQ